MDNGMKLGGFTGMPSPEQTAEARGSTKIHQGYRELNLDEKERIHTLKVVEQEVLALLDTNGKCDHNINQRSLALAKTNIQQGFMWAIRAIARPNGE